MLNVFGYFSPRWRCRLVRECTTESVVQCKWYPKGTTSSQHFTRFEKRSRFLGLYWVLMEVNLWLNELGQRSGQRPWCNWSGVMNQCGLIECVFTCVMVGGGDLCRASSPYLCGQANEQGHHSVSSGLNQKSVGKPIKQHACTCSADDKHVHSARNRVIQWMCDPFTRARDPMELGSGSQQTVPSCRLSVVCVFVSILLVANRQASPLCGN